MEKNFIRIKTSNSDLMLDLNTVTAVSYTDAGQLIFDCEGDRKYILCEADNNYGRETFEFLAQVIDPQISILPKEEGEKENA